MQEDDSFEKRLRADVEAGKLDRLITEAIAEDDEKETICGLDTHKLRGTSSTSLRI